MIHSVVRSCPRMSFFPGLCLLWLAFLWMSGWLFPHPPVALYKGPRSNFTPSHTCQLICQFHFFPGATRPAPSDPTASQAYSTAVTGDSSCRCPVHEPLYPGSRVFIFLGLLPCFGGAHPLVPLWERVQSFDTLHIVKKTLIFHSIGLILCCV